MGCRTGGLAGQWGSPRPRSATAWTCCCPSWPPSGTASPTGGSSPPLKTCANGLGRWPQPARRSWSTGSAPGCSGPPAGSTRRSCTTPSGTPIPPRGWRCRPSGATCCGATVAGRAAATSRSSSSWRGWARCWTPPAWRACWTGGFGAWPRPVRTGTRRSGTAGPKTGSATRSGRSTACRRGCARWWSSRSGIWPTRGRCVAGGGCCTGSGTSTGPPASSFAWAGGCTGSPHEGARSITDTLIGAWGRSGDAVGTDPRPERQPMATNREPMPRRPQRRSVVERIASWSARHRTVVILGWLTVVALAAAAGQAAGTRQLGTQATPGEAGRAERMLSRAGVSDPIGESVLIQDAGGGRTVSDPALRDAIQDVVATLGRFPDTAVQVRSPLQAANAGQVSRDRRAALVTFVVDRSETSAAEKAVAPIEAAVRQVQARHPGLRIEQAGQASVSRALDDTLGRDFHRAELSAVPVTLAILLVAFGALLAAGIPVLLAVSAVMAALGLLAMTSHWVPVTDSAATMILLIGLAVGVDYSLFYLRSEREERASGHDTAAAVGTAAATSGRAVVVSGLTVMISMAGLLVTGLADVNGIAIGTMLVVAVAVAGSVTVLPAVLGWLGRWVDRGRVPLLGRRRTRPGDSRLWGAVVGQVLRRPLLWGGVAAVLLVALTVPATGLRLVQPSLQQEVPASLPAIGTLDRIQAAFPGGPEPAQVVVAGDLG